MTAVTFDLAAFRAAFPEFNLVADDRLTLLFGIAETNLLDNSDGSPVPEAERGNLFNLLVAHLQACMANPTRVGRLGSATEGSVSASFDFAVTGPTQAYFAQTQYGALYWAATAKYRHAMIVANGSSGLGVSVKYGRY